MCNEFIKKEEKDEQTQRICRPDVRKRQQHPAGCKQVRVLQTGGYEVSQPAGGGYRQTTKDAHLHRVR